MNYWAVICPDKDHNVGLWRTWLQNNCVALGWHPPRWHWDSPATDKRDFENARNRASKILPGDIIIPYLCHWRFGIPAEVKRVALGDDDFDPTGYSLSHPSERGLGRRIYVRWFSDGSPPRNKVAVVPDNLRSGSNRCMVAQALEPLNAERYARFMGVIRSHHNWETYVDGVVGAAAADPDRNCSLYPDEPDPASPYFEGAVAAVQVNRYERDRRARDACLAYHGRVCAVCELSFEQRYGAIGRGFIHVHHLKPLGAIRKGYKVNPKTDLVPVCPNCHAMLHFGTTQPRPITQLRKALRLLPQPRRVIAGRES